jgi:hypothetical protein
MNRLALPLLAALALAATPALAQTRNYQPIRVDLTVYGAHASADATSWGGGVALEPKYNVTDQLAVGLRFDAAGFVTQDVRVSSGTNEASVSQGARAVTTFLAKADYYLTTTYARPFVGLGMGLYRIGAGSQEVSSGTNVTVVQSAQAFRGFGIAPQVGVNFGGFRLAATYHAVLGGDLVVATQAVGTTERNEVRLSKSFFSFELGGTIGGNRYGGYGP